MQVAQGFLQGVVLPGFDGRAQGGVQVLTFTWAGGGGGEGGSQHPGQVKGHKHTSLNAFLIPKTLPVTWTLG